MAKVQFVVWGITSKAREWRWWEIWGGGRARIRRRKHRVTLVPIIELFIVHPIEETFQFVLLTLESPLVQAERALKAPLPLQGGPSEGCIFR